MSSCRENRTLRTPPANEDAVTNTNVTRWSSASRVEGVRIRATRTAEEEEMADETEQQ